MSDMTVAPGRVQAVFLVLEAFWTWYRRNWRANLTNTVVQPALFLLALGLGFGSLVRSTATLGGMSYVEYLAPALLVATALQIGVFESTFPVLSAFIWQRRYHAMAATPITPGQIVGGHLLWMALRLTGFGLVYLAVAAALGALSGLATLLVLPVAVLTGVAASAPVAAYTATLDSEASFSGLFRFVVLPMTLFAGTYFPVDTLPMWIRPLAWVSPLWHGTELARGAAFWHAVGHVTFLLALFVVGAWSAVRTYHGRLGR
jgi:lipooligosaccharide transport system permease protein